MRKVANHAGYLVVEFRHKFPFGEPMLFFLLLRRPDGSIVLIGRSTWFSDSRLTAGTFRGVAWITVELSNKKRG